MKRTPKYVGLDVHQATTVATVREETGRVIARSVLPTEASALVEFVRGMRGAVHVALEEGTHAQWLHDLLSPVVDRVVVCDRRGEVQRGNKGDQHDADELAELLRCGRLRAVYHGSAERATLRELARTYQNLLEPHSGYFAEHPEIDPQEYRGAFALEFTPVSQLLHLPLKYDPPLVLRSSPAGAEKEALYETELTTTFGELLHAVFWELGFHGTPDGRDEARRVIDERAAAVRPAEDEQSPRVCDGDETSAI